MLSPSSSISNLANANKKFKSDDSEKPMENKAMLNGDSAAVNLKASLNNNNNLKTELNDVTNSENNNSNSNGEKKLNGNMNGTHKNNVNDKMNDEPMHEEHVENGAKIEKCKLIFLKLLKKNGMCPLKNWNRLKSNRKVNTSQFEEIIFFKV